MNEGDLGLGRARLQSASPTLHTVHNSMPGNTTGQSQTGSRYHQYQQQTPSSPAMTRLLNMNRTSGGTMTTRTAANNGVDGGGSEGPGAVMADGGGALLHPNLVNSLTMPPSNARKRKTSDNCNEDIAARRQRISEHKAQRLMRIRDRYAESAMELYLLESGGNVVDLHVWRKRPATPQLVAFLHKHRLDVTDRHEDLTLPSAASTTSAASTPTPATTTARLSQQGGSEAGVNRLKLLVATKHQGPGRPPNPENAVITQEQLVEKAKQEAYVMQRIGELQREGLWGEKRLPKQHEPSRAKAHWDYLLEEMVWMAADFAQERKWKKAAAKKCARMVQKYFQDKEAMAQKAVKSREIQLKKIAGAFAKEIKQFWSNAEKFVEFKQQTRLEEKRKKALDQHLSFIVDQTEKFSTLVAESMNKTDSVIHSRGSSRLPSPTFNAGSDMEFEPLGSSSDDEETIAKAEAEEMAEAGGAREGAEIEMLEKESLLPLDELLKDYLDHRESIPLTPSSRSSSQSPEPQGEDDEFRVSDKDTSDDEETIQEQEKAEGKVDHKQEIDALKAEGEMTIEELMAKYSSMPSPSETHTGSEVDVTSDSGKPKDVKENGDVMEESADSDDEEEEEEEEVEEDELESDMEEMDVDEESLSESIHSSEEDEFDDEDMDDEFSDSQEPDLTQLVQDDSANSLKEPKSQETTDKEINDVAALAESIQPTGNTLSSTSVVTKVPFLLKYPLREYQHIGLDWLVTMYERKLNGILADEMGLGKTIQTISLLAHLACEKGNWGPHLIVVPTSVMLNWEMELKKWCPAFKILTYYGSPKERRLKRTGWTKSNAFHICITSYKLVIQDHQSFRRKKWKYLILDEAQNIKNFKSQRWQLLLNFQTQRRLLLTGTPLQNNLMELWSLMHFLMPNVFQSHREFKEWFSNPVTGMIEGNSEYNENIIKRLHKVLRPFLLRRLKTEVEKQLPKKFEHVVMCRLSNRQRYLYDDFMSKAKTKETLATGNLLSVINVLMQLRKVCNHPNLFEVRPTVSPFQMPSIDFITASLVWQALDLDPWKTVDLSYFNFNFIDLELNLAAFVAHRIKKYSVNPKLIEEIDSSPSPPPRCPSGKIKLHVKVSNNQTQVPGLIRQNLVPVNNNNNAVLNSSKTSLAAANSKLASPLVRTLISQGGAQGLTLRVPGTQLQGYSVQLVQHQGTVKAIPVAVAPNQQQVVVASSTATTTEGAATTTTASTSASTPASPAAPTRLTVPAGAFAQLVQTSTGKHVLFTSSPCVLPGTSTVMTTLTGQRLAVLSKQGSVARLAAPGIQQLSGTRPMVRLPPSFQNALLNAAAVTSVTATTTATSTTSAAAVTTTSTTTTTTAAAAAKSGQQQMLLTMSPSTTTSSPSAAPGLMVTRQLTLIRKKSQQPAAAPSEFNIPSLEEKRQQCRCAKLSSLAAVNRRKCLAYPVYGADLRDTLSFVEQPPPTDRRWACTGHINCLQAKADSALAGALLSVEDRLQQMEDIINRFVVFVPAVVARSPQLHTSHPPPWKVQEQRLLDETICRALRSESAHLHTVSAKMATQFPDPRLIQYDCGKLQTLDQLLRRLKANHSRVLIFTQMTRMLDVLEAFLNFHGHIYLRLDGSTRVDQRQALMERFNADKRIFVFILTTRSGGVGVNLTGADTVIFYDSDWNPTMDAQAQDRCHRIGQTRDVHIYRLISEKTVEENILKKANQKRMLGDLAIEGGNFTTAYFKSSTIQELFNVDVSENDANTRMAEVLKRDADRKRNVGEESSTSAGSAVAAVEDQSKTALGRLESAMALAEDESDVVAAKTVQAEAAAQLAEFDESIPLDGESQQPPTEELSKAEQEVNALIDGMNKLEKYAMRFIEETDSAWSAEQLAAAEAEIELQKREWEKNRLAALRGEQREETSPADDMITYTGDNARQVTNEHTTRSKATLALNLWTLDKQSTPNANSTPINSPSPYSNPNLVIRTRRASSATPTVKAAANRESDSTPPNLKPVSTRTSESKPPNLKPSRATESTPPNLKPIRVSESSSNLKSTRASESTPPNLKPVITRKSESTPNLKSTRVSESSSNLKPSRASESTPPNLKPVVTRTSESTPKLKLIRASESTPPTLKPVKSVTTRVADSTSNLNPTRVSDISSNLKPVSTRASESTSNMKPTRVTEITPNSKPVSSRVTDSTPNLKPTRVSDSSSNLKPTRVSEDTPNTKPVSTRTSEGTKPVGTRNLVSDNGKTSSPTTEGAGTPSNTNHKTGSSLRSVRRPSRNAIKPPEQPNGPAL